MQKQFNKVKDVVTMLDLETKLFSGYKALEVAVTAKHKDLSNWIRLDRRLGSDLTIHKSNRRKLDILLGKCKRYPKLYIRSDYKDAVFKLDELEKEFRMYDF